MFYEWRHSNKNRLWLIGKNKIERPRRRWKDGFKEEVEKKGLRWKEIKQTKGDSEICWEMCQTRRRTQFIPKLSNKPEKRIVEKISTHSRNLNWRWSYQCEKTWRENAAYVYIKAIRDVFRKNIYLLCENPPFIGHHLSVTRIYEHLLISWNPTYLPFEHNPHT